MAQQPRELDPARSPRALFGYQLRRLRESAGLSQEALGADIHLSGAAIGSYERSRSLPAEAEARCLDDTLGADGLLFATWQLASRNGGADSHAHTPAVSIQTGPRSSTMEPHPHGLEPEDELMTAAERAADFGSWVEQLSGGAVAAEMLHHKVRRLALGCLTLPPATIMMHAEPLQHEVFRLAREPRRPAQAREMFAVAAQLCTLMGMLAGDRGDLDAAELQARAAWACAEAADDSETSAWVLSLRAKNAFWRNDFTGSAEAAQRGQRYAGAGTSLLMLICQEADAYSKLRAVGQTLDALQRADQAAERVRTADRLGGPFTCSPARHATYVATTQLRLGPDHADHSLRDADRALGMVDDATTFGSVAQMHVTKTLALAHAGQIDGAAQAARPVLDLPPSHRLATIIGRLRPIATLLERPALRTSAVARDLRAEVVEFCHGSSDRPQLTAGTREDATDG